MKTNVNLLLNKELPLVGKPYAIAYSVNKGYKATGWVPIGSLYPEKVTPELLEFLNSSECKGICYLSGADDIRTGVSDKLGGVTVVSSCDVGRGMLKYPDGKLEIGSPYQLWDKFYCGSEEPFTWMSGRWVGRKYFINKLHYEY